jgi:hypothetical protein
MIAEINNKISQSGRNLSDRLEDKLTGDFFGTIRYLPFEFGLKQVLSSTLFPDAAEGIEFKKKIKQETGFRYEIQFWPRHDEGEIDLILTFGHATVGIEVKYLSGLSSEDDDDPLVEVTPEESRNQLARYSRLLERLEPKGVKYLIFLAPFRTVKNVENALKNRPILSPGVVLGFLTWEDVLSTLEGIETLQLNNGQEKMIADLAQLLRHKGFFRFHGFGSVSDVNVTTNSYQFEYSKENSWEWPIQKVDGRNSYVFKD